MSFDVYVKSFKLDIALWFNMYDWVYRDLLNTHWDDMAKVVVTRWLESICVDWRRVLWDTQGIARWGALKCDCAQEADHVSGAWRITRGVSWGLGAFKVWETW